MGADNILEAVDKLEASTQKVRKEGLEELQRILVRPRSSTKLHKLKDEGWQKVLDILYNLIRGDKHDLLSGSATAQKRAANRLETIASSFRVVVNSCTPYITHKLAHLVLDRICEYLYFDRENEEPFRKAVQTELVRSFCVILSNDSHAEHLLPDAWQKYADFLLEAIDANLANLGGLDDDDDDDAVSTPRGLSLSGSGRTTLPLLTSQSSNNRGPRSEEAQLMDDMVVALRNLTSITNCPLQSRMTGVAQTVLRTLSTSLQTKDAAFECLNNILMLARTEEVALVSHIAAQVVVIIRQLWSHKIDGKSTSLTEQMLVSLMLIRSTLYPDELSVSETDSSALDLLSDHMLLEYDSRTQQYCLQISDLKFSNSPIDDFLGHFGIAPDLESPTATAKWTTVALIASLRNATRPSGTVTRHAGVNGDRSAKRQRISIKFPELVRLLFVEPSDVKIEEVLEFLNEMLASLPDDRASKSSWILLVASRLCRLPLANAPELREYWIQLWASASHLITSIFNSRAACFAMMTLIETGMLKDHLTSSTTLDSCFRSGSRGPPSLTDSAMLLFSSCLQSNVLQSERNFKDFRDKVLSWLDVVWTLPGASEYAKLEQLARMARSPGLYNLLMALCGKQARSNSALLIACMSPIYSAHICMSETKRFVAFLAGKTEGELASSDHTDNTIAIDKLDSSRVKQSNFIVVEFLAKKLDDLRNLFREVEMADCMDKTGIQLISKRRANLSVDMAMIMISSCAAAALMIGAVNSADLTDTLRNVWECVLDYLRLQRENDNVFELACTRTASVLLQIKPATEDEKQDFATKRSMLVAPLRRLIENRGASQDLGDDMDLDFDVRPINSQPSQNKLPKYDQNNSRRDLSVSSGVFGSLALAQFELLREDSYSDLVQRPMLSSVMTDFCLTLSADDFLTVRTALLDWLHDNNYITTSDATRILQKVATVCLSKQNERNEAALCFCLKVLRSTEHLWISTEDQNLADIVLDIYSWFIKTALAKGIASTKVLYNLSKVLEPLLHRHGYGAQFKLKSPRTSLLKILKTARSSLRFEMVPGLLTVFDGYVLSTHADIFDDIVDCLPTDAADQEGIAVRYYILGRLGARWRTVLRQAIYHIFETAANVPSMTSIAKKTLEMISREVGPEMKPAKLLHLFSPQLLFTWLDDGFIETIPYKAFGYTSLRDLIDAEATEIVAQTVMRQSERHQQTASKILGQIWQESLLAHFPKAQVYAIATDFEARDEAAKDALESALQKQLGVEAYANLCRCRLPEAVAYAILALEDDRGFDKVVGSSSRYKSVSQIYNTICDRSSSSLALPPQQQPSFRAKTVLQVVNKLCINASIQPESLWTPALLVYTYRKLLDNAEPALGPLHVASMIRSIRVVVALGGKSALEGYALEMLLHNLRPYLTNFHCAEDTLGIFWYLLQNGVQYLERNLSFLTGLSVTIFVSLSAFATSSQESTTQESQFVSTMSKAQEFRKWLGSFLTSLETSQLGPEHTSTFQNIIRDAKEITTSGTNNRHEHEGSLLGHVICDQTAETSLVSPRFFRMIIRALSEDFRMTTDASADIFYDSSFSAAASSSVLHLALSSYDLSGTFKTWLGSVFGRAYTAEGPGLDLCSAVRRWDHLKHANKVLLDLADSHRYVIQSLVDTLWAENRIAASIAEQSLHSVLGCLKDADRKMILVDLIEGTKLEDLIFQSDQCPKLQLSASTTFDIDSMSILEAFDDAAAWAASLVELLIIQDLPDQFLIGIIPVLRAQRTITEQVLPMIIHVVLASQTDHAKQSVRETLSQLFANILKRRDTATAGVVQLILETVLYLRRCSMPHETTPASRNAWLQVDFSQAAAAALHHGLPEIALLMFEIGQAEQTLQLNHPSRRSSVKVPDPPFDVELLTRIFNDIPDEDFFYGCHQEESLASVLAKLNHEGGGAQALAFQSALFDSSTRTSGLEFALQQSGAVVSALASANMHGLAFATSQYAGAAAAIDGSRSQSQSVLNVHQWNFLGPGQGHKDVDILNEVLAKLEKLENKADICSAVNCGLQALTAQLDHGPNVKARTSRLLATLSAISEIQQLVSATAGDALSSSWSRILDSISWSGRESFESTSTIMLAREAASAAMKRNEKSNQLFHTKQSDLLLHEIRAVKHSLATAEQHDAAQYCLNKAAYLTSMQATASDLSLDVESAITFAVANTLWSQGEITAPIQMLRTLQNVKGLGKAVLPISEAELLTDLGQKLSQARLEHADEITARYLQPAIEALGNATAGPTAGRVYHNFAAFCDEQLQDPVAKDDFDRITVIRNRKLQEVAELADMYKHSSGGKKNSLSHAYKKAKTWAALDDEEYERMQAHRAQLLQRSLENYLLSMQACDDFSNDILRLMSLWLSNSDASAANKAVQKYVGTVPTVKLAPFVNQLCSRLLSTEDRFQKVLFELLFRICCDHPYHSLYQVFAVYKTKGVPGDKVAESRVARGKHLSTTVHSKGGRSSRIWVAIHNINIHYVNFANESPGKKVESGAKLLFKNFSYGQKLEHATQASGDMIPPPTMNINLRVDKDYSSLPVFRSFEPRISIAGGVSKPKIITIISSDGARHKLLLKGGNDDLRQDAIMEQVFAQVSDLLRDHRATRQRNLGIRTYKVIPLTHNAGIIEFVKNTLPLHDYIMPAHERYFPKDYKQAKCRRLISDVEKKGLEERLRAYRDATSHFHPIMRFFFMEHFLDPHEWFEKRLNYSRSTAAISMLGHVLGLGDRHGHNILLDTQTGEVVHIDLGVAFETGRVLPIPEVIPFRLTRDIVDGMGISGVEGPFRRCCNFTLEALRKSQDAIMTILDVLRYDPLHSWSTSPLRVQRMQDQQEREDAAAAAAAKKNVMATPVPSGEENEPGGQDQERANAPDGLKVSNEPGEADRALDIVKKKLSAGLSVEATVNDLIRQATDERNLAVLYCGWAAFA